MSNNFEVENKILNSNIGLAACHYNQANSGPVGLALLKNKLWTANSGTASVGFTGATGLTGGPFLSEYKEDGKLVKNVTTFGIPFGLAANEKCNQFNGYKLLATTSTGGTGYIEGFNPCVDPTHTVSLITATGAYAGFYSGIALSCGNIYVANTTSGNIDVFTSTLTYSFSFTDPNLTPFNVVPTNLAVYKKKLYVTFARVNASNLGVNALGNGFIDVFSLQGTCLKRLVNLDPLDAPYGLAFSKCGKYILVTNHGNGLINVFDRKKGCFIGRFKDCNGEDLVIGGLNSIVIGCDSKIYYTSSTTVPFGGVVGQLENCC
jgi:DNA-binding beta-propeller fold protein YncE